MKVRVDCSACGRAFGAPQVLIGQQVRCPDCGGVNVVPQPKPGDPPFDEQAAASPQSGSKVDDLSLLAPPGGKVERPTRRRVRTAVSSSAETVSGSSMQGAEVTESDSGSGEDDLSGRMERLYGIYAGKELRGGRRGRFTIGLGICLAVVLIAVGIGVYMLVNMESSSTTVTTAPAPQVEQTGPRTAQQIADAQQIDANAAWAAPADQERSAVELQQTRVDLDWSHDGQVNAFQITLQPQRSGDNRLPMATEAALFRGDSPDGPFTQVDRARVRTVQQGALVFEMNDATFRNVNANRLYYRLSGFDINGGRLFDTPPVAVPIVKPARVLAGQVLWEPVRRDGDVPVVGVLVRPDGDDWRGVSLSAVRGDGPLDVTVPEAPVDVPMRVMMTIAWPTHVELDSDSRGQWMMEMIEHPIATVGPNSDKPVEAVVPVASGELLDHRVIGSESVGGEPDAQSLSLDPPPVPMFLTATPYDDAIRLGWDHTGLSASRHRYTETAGIAVYRNEPGAPPTLLATLPIDAAGYTDTSVQPGSPYQYMIRLVDRDAPGSPARVISEAYIAGAGIAAVQIEFPFEQRSAAAATEPAIPRLHVVFARNELTYPYSGGPAVETVDRVIAWLLEASEAEALQRGLLSVLQGGAMAADNGGAGLPGQVMLRLVDHDDRDGTVLQLWASDLASGESRMLADTPVDQPDVDHLVDAAKTYLQSRLREPVEREQPAGVAPQRILFADLLPADQPVVNHNGPNLVRQWSEALAAGQPVEVVIGADARAALRDRSGPASTPTLLLTGRMWMNDALESVAVVYAIDPDTSMLVGRFTPTADADAAQQFVEWVGGLTVGASPEMSGASALLSNESSLEPINTVWREHADELAANMSPPSIDPPPGATVISVGSPLPAALAPAGSVQAREPSDPLRAVQPIVAAPFPLTDDQWVRQYSDYLANDLSAYTVGIERLNDAFSKSAVTLHLIVRGQAVETQAMEIRQGVRLQTDPRALNWQPTLPIGRDGREVIDYRRQLAAQFTAEPYMTHRAWMEQRVPELTAEAFLQAQVAGVVEGRAGPITRPTRPPRIDQYLAAVALEQRGEQEAAVYRQEAQAASHTVLTELGQSGETLSGRRAQWVTNALLILAYENDPSAVSLLSNAGFRRQYLTVEPDSGADTLRMLVDRVGDQAYVWAHDWEGVQWERFRWDGPDTMLALTDSQPGLLPEPLYVLVRTWLGAPIEQQPDLPEEASPTHHPAADPEYQQILEQHSGQPIHHPVLRNEE